MAAIRDFNLCVNIFIFLGFLVGYQHVEADPVLSPFRVINVHEDLSVQTVLAAVNCTDTDDVAQRCFSCNIVRAFNDGVLIFNGLVNTNTQFFNFGPFDILLINSGFINNNQFGVVFVPGRGFNLDYSVVRTYYLDIQCSGILGNNSEIQRLEIDIFPNQAPVIAGLPGVTLFLDARTITPGTSIYQLVVTDNENDTLTYGFSVDPVTVDQFQLNVQTGLITAAKHLLTATVTPVTLRVNVTDTRRTVGPLTITINILNMNTRPTITNLPINITLNEDAPAGTLIATLTLSDPDIFQVLEPVFSVNPVSEASKFVYQQGTRQVRLAAVPNGQTLLDAESVSSLNLSFALFDGHLSSVNNYILLTIANVNEPPFFDKTVYSCTLFEANQLGSSCDLGLTIRDPEGDVLFSPVLNPANNSALYTLENGFLRIGNNYIVDNGLFPSAATLTIEVADDKGATGSALIQVTVLDQNTQSPDFGGSQNFFVIVQDTLTIPATIATITATDNDLTSPNNAVSLRLQSSINLGNSVIFSDDGRITYLNRFNPNKDCSSSACQLVIIAFDGGNPPRTSTTTFNIGYVTTTTTTTTTTTAAPVVVTTAAAETTTTTTVTTTIGVQTTTSVFDNPGAAAVLGILIALLVLALLALIGYFIYRYCRYGTCCGPTGAGARGGYGNGGGGGGGGGSGGSRGNGLCGNCCGEPEKVRPIPEGPDGGVKRTPQGFRGEDVYKSRGDYKDDFWNTKDNYGDVNGRPTSMKSVRIGGFTPPPGGQRALPAPRPGPGYGY